MIKRSNKLKRILTLLLALVMILGQVPLLSFAENEVNEEDLLNPISLEEVESFMKQSLEYIHKTTSNPKYGSEWSILSLARGRYDVGVDYYNQYYENILSYIKDKIEEIGEENKIDKSKSTEHSKLILSLTSIGLSPENLDGINLIEPLANFNYINKQGLNSCVFGLIALDSLDYELPILDNSEGKQTTRDLLIDDIISKELSAGGWAIFGEQPDVDMTAMVIQALAPYYNTRKDVEVSINKALDWLSENQLDNGGYKSWGSESSESIAQVIVALAELKGHGVKVDLNKFTKENGSLIQALMSFKVEGGGFKHTRTSDINSMATDQCTYALVSYVRMMKNLDTLYSMHDYNSTPGYLQFNVDKEPIEPIEVKVSYGGVSDGDIFISKNLQFAVEVDEGEIVEVLGNDKPLEDITESIPASSSGHSFSGRVFLLPLEEGKNTICVKVKVDDQLVEDKIQVFKESKTLEEFLNDTLKYMYETTPEPSFGTGGGEWTVLSLARGRYDVSEDYYDKYYENVKREIKKILEKTSNQGKLNRNKGTEHSRLILGFTAAGLDPRDIDGFNALEALADFNYIKKQGINGPIFALIAFDSGNYEIPKNSSPNEQVTRDRLIDYILSREIEETGGWSLIGNADVDITAMAIQSLAPYYNKRSDVKKAVDKALKWLSDIQRPDGSYFAWGANNAESTSQVIVALAELVDNNVDVNMDDFVKGNNTLIDGLMEFSIHDGGFMHVKAGPDASGGSGIAGQRNGMATDQGTYALVSYLRMKNKLPSLYNMTDIAETPGNKLKEKNSNLLEKKEELNNLITELNLINLEKYQEDGVIKLKKALEEAGLILDDQKAQEKEISEKIAELLKLRQELIEKPAEKYDGYITLSIDKDTINYPRTLEAVRVGFYEGESVWDVLKREMDERGIGYEYEWTEKYGSVYVQWIDGDGEFDHGEGSGWMYNVNGWYPNYGASKYILKDGDIVQWRYTTDLGADLGEDLSKWPLPGEEDEEDRDKEDISDNGNSDKQEDKNRYPKEIKEILDSMLQAKDSSEDVFLELDRLNDKLIEEDYRNQNLAKKLKDMENIFTSFKQLDKSLKKDQDRQVFAGKILDTNKNFMRFIDEKDLVKVENNIKDSLGLILKNDKTLAKELVELFLKIDKVKGKNPNKAYEKIVDIKLSEGYIPGELIGAAKSKKVDKLAVELEQVKLVFSLKSLKEEDINIYLNTKGNLLALKIENSKGKIHRLEEEVKLILAIDNIKNPHSLRVKTIDGKSLGGIYDKSSKSLVFKTKDIGEYLIEENRMEFEDLEGHWSKDYIENLASKGFVKGTKPGLFEPKRNITRAEFVTLINRIIDNEIDSSYMPFKDVDENKWYAKEIASLYKLGLINGVSLDRFNPDGEITREEIGTIIANILKSRSYISKNLDSLKNFKDKDQISAWSQDNMELLVELGLVKGDENLQINPRAKASRGEVSTMLYRFYKLLILE